MLMDFLSGAVATGFVVAGLFFLRFWKDTRDSLFISFALAFWLLGIEQGLKTLAEIPVEERSWMFLLRLAAFSLILASIGIKNWKARH